VRGYAACAIGLLGVEGQSVVPDLLKLARAQEAIVRQNAIRALGSWARNPRTRSCRLSRKL
jgi:hypothetical protein